MNEHWETKQKGVGKIMDNLFWIGFIGVGASSIALFARVGGGIYTKAADVGADLVGKVEAGIPEDDPRNPAVIADNVGDNVGDVAGMGADLFESYVGYTAAILAAILAAPLTYCILGGHMGVYIAILCGLIGGCAIGYFTEYYTSDTYKPTQDLAAASETGSATIIIGGISLGLRSTMTSILIVAAAVLISYFAAGGTNTIVDSTGAFTQAFNQGLYGIGIAGVGMLSTLGITLATDAYGPVADNAGGIAEMAGLPETVRERTDALDSLGNTTAATGKGFAIGSASLTALALLVSYVNIVQENTSETLNFTLTSPTVLVGMFIGAMLTFVFSAFTMSAVQKAAQSIVVEVRRQFKSIPGIMEYKADPDYASCVGLCTKGALHEMVAPALLAIIVPLSTGLILGPTGVVGLLGGVSVTGFAMAVFMSNAGGAWDNAKKYIEGGHHGGKGSEQHKAAVVGDTVGDPFKDTSGPSLNILIKLCSTVSIVFSGLILAFNLMNIL
jgi:K(+)-stimulated pyrophosphate-energized sodium pump